MTFTSLGVIYFGDKMTFTIPNRYAGKALKEFLYENLKISRATLTKLKKLPLGITLNGEHVTVRAILNEGDILELQIEDREDEENEYVIPCGELPPILYEDDSLIILNKPSGMPTHTSIDHRTDSLANAVCAHFKNLGQSFVFRAVNRLDGDTTGIVMIAKNRYYACLLSRALANGEFKKEYIAVLDGETEKSGRVCGYVKREADSIIKRTFSAEETLGAEYSETYFITLDSKNGKSIVLARPITGRTHQLRLHFSSLGAPICGDFLYGTESNDIPRQALHAYSLTFPSPSLGKTVKVFAPIPDDIKLLMQKHSLTIPKDFKKETNEEK